MEMEIRDVLANSLGIRTDALHAFQRVKNHLQVPERVQGRAFAQTAAEINKRNCQSCIGQTVLGFGKCNTYLRRRRSTISAILLAHAFGRFLEIKKKVVNVVYGQSGRRSVVIGKGPYHGDRDLNSPFSSPSLNKSGTRGFPPRSRNSSSSSVTGPQSEYPCR